MGIWRPNGDLETKWGFGDQIPTDDVQPDRHKNVGVFAFGRQSIAAIHRFYIRMLRPRRSVQSKSI
jgi:hypothetical protein